MSADNAMKAIIIAVFCVFSYFATLYAVRWKWHSNAGGRIIMSMASCMIATSTLGIIGVTWPDWKYRIYVRMAGWGFILVVGIVASVAMTMIRKPPDRE